MGVFNHLKQIDARNTFRAVAYGEHCVNGVLGKSLVEGASPNHQITIQQFLGRDEWEAVSRGIYWKNLSIPPADWKFYPGRLSTGLSDPIQGVDDVFSSDTPHSLVPWMRVKLPGGVGEFDTKQNPPQGFQGYFKTKKVADYDRNGNVTDFLYSTNAARQVADLILRQGKRDKSLIDWAAWCDWRDFLNASISYDYRQLADFDGFGLTAKYYYGTNFNNFHSKRIDWLIAFFSDGGVPAYGLQESAYSAEYEGYVKFDYSGEHKFTITADNGVRVWINGNQVVNKWTDDGLNPPSVTEFNFTPAAAGAFVPIKIQWNNGGVIGEIKLEWELTTGNLLPKAVVPSKNLYPKEEMRPRYETHPFFNAPTRLDDAMRVVLNLCDSVYQKVNGKYRFFCLEQLTATSFAMTDDHIISITPKPKDRVNLRNKFSAAVRDIDSRFLEQLPKPMTIERKDLQDLAGRAIGGDDLQFFNMTRHQAWRLLNQIAARECDALPVEITANASTFPVLGGDLIKISTELFNWTDKEFLVLQSNDASSEETADERNFSLQEWTNAPNLSRPGKDADESIESIEVASVIGAEE